MARYGVTRYTEGDVSVVLGAVAEIAPVAQPADDAALELPDGLIDPRKKLAEIYRKRVA